MNFKVIKETKQEIINETIKSMVNSSVTVQSNYDMEKEVVSLLLIDEIKNNEVLEKLVIYNCAFSVEQNSLSVTGFARRFGYDNFGVAQVINEPITVDEPFINGIKMGIAQSLSVDPEQWLAQKEAENTQAAEAEPTAPEVAQESETPEEK